MYDVSVVPCPSYDPAVCRAALEAVLAPLGGLDWVRPGMRIAVKANLVAAMRPEKAATTHPVLLAELTKLLTARGASVVIGDSPSGLYTPAALQAVYRAAGLSLAEEAGAVLNRDCSQAEAVFPEARVAKTFQYTAWLDGADAVIDFCKLKSHGMMGLSAAAKNLFGTIPGTRKPEYHFRYSDPADFARMLVDLAEYWRPRLCLVDAVVAMEGNGPTAGTPRPLGALLAGVSPHRVDLACAALIGLGPNRVPTLAAARERGLIPASAAELSVSGGLAALGAPDFRTVSAPSSHLFTDRLPGPLGRARSRLLGALFASRPEVHPSQCVGCGKCAAICPAKAINMRERLPDIDRSRCIRCFCCQEFCPKGAMRVRRTALARLLNRSSK